MFNIFVNLFLGAEDFGCMWTICVWYLALTNKELNSEDKNKQKIQFGKKHIFFEKSLKN